MSAWTCHDYPSFNKGEGRGILLLVVYFGYCIAFQTMFIDMKWQKDGIY